MYSGKGIGGAVVYKKSKGGTGIALYIKDAFAHISPGEDNFDVTTIGDGNFTYHNDHDVSVDIYSKNEDKSYRYHLTLNTESEDIDITLSANELK